ncbi:MAG: flippase [Chlorobi bacterium]|nr:flippase [Chlorobiota bacterium]
MLYRFVGIWVSIYLARGLGAEILGGYAVVMNIIGIFMAFTDLGVTNFVIKEVSQDESRAQIYLDNFFALQLVAGIIIVGLIVFTGEASGYPGIFLVALVIGSIGPFFSGLANTYNTILSAKSILYPFAVIEIVCMLVYAVSVTVVIILHQGIVALVAASSLIAIVKYTLGKMWASRFQTKVRWRPDPAVMKRLVWMGFPFLLLNGAHFAMQRLDVIILSWLVSSNIEVGYYAAASRLIVSSLFFIGASGTLLYPMMGTLIKADKEKARLLYRKASLYLAVFSAFVAVAFYVMAPLIVRILYGDGYDQSVFVLRLLCWFIPLNALGLMGSTILMVGGNVWRVVWANVIALVAMISAEFVLIPVMGIQGAAVGLVGAELIPLVVYTIEVVRIFGFHLPLAKIAGVVLATVLAIALHTFGGMSQEWSAIVYPLAVMILVVIVGRIITMEDVRRISAMVFRWEFTKA